MSTPIAKRPVDAARNSPGGRPGSPSRTRGSTPGSGAGAAAPATATGTTASPSVGRTRSIRSSTLVSGRAGAGAAATRRESRMSQVTSADAAAAATEAQEAARAEMLALLDDLKERLSQAENQAEQYRRQSEVQQAKLDEALREHVRLEERTHEYDEQTDVLRNEKREMARQMQQMETIYEAERSAMTREKEDMANREEEMQTVIQRLKDSLAQRANGDEDARPSRQTNNSPSIEGGFAPPSSLQRSDSRNNSKLLLQKDKLIESLRLELAEAQIKLVESENQGGGRLHEVERQLMEARMANARLMEDNESYQLLLQEKTLKGDFDTADLGFASSSRSGRRDRTHSRPRSSNQDALNALEGRGSSLADELSGAVSNDNDSDSEDTSGGLADGGALASPNEVQRRLEAELKSVQDQNKAMTLYINKIIERLLEHQDYQYILDKSTDGKQPPPPSAASANASSLVGAGAGAGANANVHANTNKDLPPAPAPAPSFLQRAKTMTIGGSGSSFDMTRTRQRPMSVMPQTAHNNPKTAPSIPISLTRSTSVRRTRPMSEQYTGSGGTSAASVVNAMYKGPDGPLSPTLRSSGYFLGGANVNGSPGGSNGHNGHNGHNGNNSNGSHHSNGASHANTGSLSNGSNGQRSPGLPSSGNFPGMRSETSSVSGDMGGSGGSGSGSSDTSPPTSSGQSQSPPRQHEKTAFTGSKPRPLRLVQENTDSVKTDAANKRASWIGWAFGKKEEGSNAEAIME